ncbi:MAG: hypothetical protein IJQ97_07505, partial [Paludibacteraceae bacterium]|nr:hypothetical protein [Paludibacteraceae bacterium]
MRKLFSFLAATLFAVSMMAGTVVLPATLDVSNVSFRSEGMPDFVIEAGQDYAGTYFDMGAHDSSNDTLLYAEWDVKIEPIKYNVAVDVYNTNSWRVQIDLLNQSNEVVKDIRYKGSSGQKGQFAIGSMDLSDLEAGDYKVRARAATAWSAMKLKDVIFDADYQGVSVALPGTLLPAYAMLSAGASVANNAIAFAPGTAPDEYATWNVSFAQAGTYNVTIDFTATNGHTYGVSLLSADGSSEVGAVAEAQAWDTGVKDLGAIIVPAAGNYKVKLTNATQWSEAVLNSITFVAPQPALEPATYYGAEGFLTEGAVIAPAQWTACEYSITRNADKTLTFVAEFTNDVTGLVGQINLGDGFKDMAKDGLKFTYSTTATYEDGAALEGAFFYFPYAGAAKRIDITYTVGAANDKPATPVDARMKGAYNIGGETADFATLSEAISAIETNGMMGDVDLVICADLAENTNIGITNNTDYTLTIRPDKAEKRTITYGDQADNDGPSGHILVGALMAKDFNTTLATKNVWFDGSVDGEGQYLEIRAGAVGGRTVVFYGDVTNSGIKNCRIINPRATGTNYAVEIRTEKNSDKRPVGIVIENNYIEDNGSANTQAIQFNGSQSATADGKPKDVVIRNNEIVANLRCIFFNGAENAVIEGNTFRLAKASAGFLAHGIMGNAQKGAIIVRGNKFLELGTMNASAGEYGICGITASGNADVWVIENNVFAGLDAKADVAGKNITLRYVRCGDSCVVRNNTFYLPAQTYKPATDLVAAQAVTCLWLAGTKLYIAENNLLVSEETEVNNSLIRGALNENVKNNVFFHKGGNAAVLAGAVVAKTWEEFAALEGTAGSKWTEPKFVDAANGDFAIAEYNEGLLIPRLESVLTDIDGKDRAEQTCAGAFEFVGEPVVDDTYFEYTVTETIAKNTETEATGGTIIFGADK